jgi:hypothetical protein
MHNLFCAVRRTMQNALRSTTEEGGVGHQRQDVLPSKPCVLSVSVLAG